MRDQRRCQRFAGHPILPYIPDDPLIEKLALIEVSVVIPCLDEAATVGICVAKARWALAQSGITGEIIVANNGSTDDSRTVALGAGARVVEVRARGYGRAVMGGIAAARGTYVVMADADDSYDFREIPRFVEKLREGFDLVQGCRLRAGGGTVVPGAMPVLHRWIGNPMFSSVARLAFNVRVHDIHCGMRAFTLALYEQLGLRCPGMEFAVEMVMAATRGGARIAELPVTLYPDGRTAHPPHLRPLRDGLRSLRLLMLFPLR
jgi:glycosyltransferase involved in cell wall biosynthesis